MSIITCKIIHNMRIYSLCNHQFTIDGNKLCIYFVMITILCKTNEIENCFKINFRTKSLSARERTSVLLSTLARSPLSEQLFCRNSVLEKLKHVFLRFTCRFSISYLNFPIECTLETFVFNFQKQCA